ncbi:MAG: uroporphyrinogen decarboxylase family protein [Phycisphaerae bacterium]
MSEHIDAMKRAIEFRKPAHLPMEVMDVPGIYNAYHTLDPNQVELIPGTETFDSLWPCCYSWIHHVIGRTPEGEVLKKDQFGAVLKTPRDENSTYVLLEHPLADKDTLAGYHFPNPDDADAHYDDLGNVIKERYPDRFVDAFIDAGMFLTTQLLFGLEGFLMKLADNPAFVADVYERVMEYYRAVIPKFKKAGAHMITAIEDIGSTDSLLINPDVWRRYFKPVTKRFFKHVHDEGLYTGICIDGNSRDVLDDLLDMDIDLFTVVDIKTTGIDAIKGKLKGKMCVKASVDMQST